MAAAINPWKGLKAYSEGEILYGRNDDIQALSQYIINNTQTVLYGRSGIGKSSILNAGVFPIARQQGLYPVPIRLEHDSEETYVQQLNSAVKSAGLQAHEVVPVIDSKEESLWEFIHRQYFTKAGDNQKVQPLFVIDQFEEIFTLQKSEKKKLIFFSQLADLLNDVCPLYIHENYCDEAANRNPRINQDLNEVTSLDDFTFDLGDDENNSAVTADYIESPAYHIVLAMREDFLSYLERYTSYIPVMKKNRFGLNPLNEEQAAEIIMNPCPGLVDIDVAEHIIQKVTGRTDFTLDGIPEIEVDSAVLSLYLSRLFEKKNPESDKLTNELVDIFGDDIIKDFYLESIADLSPKTIGILEYQLLTAEGRRDNVSRSDLELSGVSAQQIDSLVNDKKILRQFSYGNDIRIEYIHDILCPVIAKLKEEKELEKLKQQQKAVEENRHQENRRRNQQRVQSDLNVLTVRGRKILDNTLDFGAFENNHYLSNNSGCHQDFLIAEADSLLDFNFRYWHHNEVSVSSIGRLIDIGKGNIYTTCIEFKDSENHSIRTLDGISKMNVTFDGDLIKQIDFIKVERNYQGLIQEKPFYIKGFCAIRLDYDDSGRETKRTYMDEEHHPVPIFGGYAIIKRHYDAVGNLAEVKYYDADNLPTCHWNGNHGYSSQFNEDGQEIRRMFFDTEMNITRVTSGICGRAFEYDSEGRIAYEENLDENQCITADNKGYIGVKFQYDELSRLTRETYLDQNRNPMIAEDGDAITITTYEKNSFTEHFLDDKGNDTTRKEGYYEVYYRFDERLHPISIQYLYKEGISAKVDDIGKMIFYWNNDGFLQSLKSYDRNGFFRNALWVLYDMRNLFILYSGSLDEKGQKTADNDGGYGQMFERDERGMVTGLWNINRYNQLSPSDDGISVWRITRIVNGDLAKWLYYDYNQIAHPDSDGAYGYELEFDDQNNETAKICLDRNGRPGPNLHGIQTVKKLYNNNGELIEERYYDSHDKPCADEYGDYGTRYEYRLNPRVFSCISIRADGKPHNCSSGQCYANTHFDEKSRTILIEFLDVNRDPIVYLDSNWYAIKTTYNDDDNSNIETYIGIDGQVVNGNDGIASTYTKKDELGRIILQKQYDEKGNLICDSDGDYGTAYEYSQDGREVSIISLDANGDIHANSSGYAILRKLLDEQGREIERYYYDAERKPTQYQDYFGYRTIYTDQDNKFIYMVLDNEGKPLYSASNGYFAVEKTVDGQERTIHQRYLDAELQPMADYDGSYGAQWTYNDEEKSVELSRLDIDGNVMEMDNGVAYEFRINDEQGRKIYSCNYDINHHMVPDNIGVYGARFNYLDDGAQLIEYLDQERNPMLSNQGCGAIYRVFDDLGRTTFEMWLDLEGKPSPNALGVSGMSREFMDDGRVLLTWLDAEQHPTADEDGEISTLTTLDDQGREISKICLDADLKPAACNDGWIRRDMEYDEQGEVICHKFYDADGNPMPNRYGDYGMRLLPVEQPNEEWIAFLGEDGKLHPNQQGFASRYRAFDESRRVIKEMVYDKYGAPLQDSLGAYGNEYEYLEDGSKLEFSLNKEGERETDGHGVFFYHSKEDDKGRITWFRRFDEQGHPMQDDNGDYGICRLFDDESHLVETISLNFEGEPHNNRNGFCSHFEQYDEQDRIVLDYAKTVEGDYYIDKDGLCITKTQYDEENPRHRYIMNLNAEGEIAPMRMREGLAYTEKFEDEQGRTVKQLWFDKNGDLCPDDDGVCGIHNKYITSENGEEVCIFSHYNSREEIITDEHGRTYFKKTVDKVHRQEMVVWFNAEMEPTATTLGNYGCIFEYTDEDLSILQSVISLDQDYTPHNNNKGYSRELLISDATGNSRSLYFDLEGNFVDVDMED